MLLRRRPSPPREYGQHWCCYPPGLHHGLWLRCSPWQASRLAWPTLLASHILWVLHNVNHRLMHALVGIAALAIPQFMCTGCCKQSRLWALRDVMEQAGVVVVSGHRQQVDASRIRGGKRWVGLCTAVLGWNNTRRNAGLSFDLETDSQPTAMERALCCKQLI